MSLIFAPGKYLTLILLFMDIFFSISPDIVESPKKSVVPFLHSSLFCCKVLLSALLMFSVGVVWIPCLVNLFCGLLYFNHRAVLTFWTVGRLMFGRFINYNFKIYTRWFTTNGFWTVGRLMFGRFINCNFKIYTRWFTTNGFWTVGRLMFGRFINYNIKIYTRWFTANAFSSTRCIKFANYWRGIFSFKFDFSWTELEWCGVVWKFLFPCWCS